MRGGMSFPLKPKDIFEELRKSVEQCRDRKGVRVTEFDNPPPA